MADDDRTEKSWHELALQLSRLVGFIDSALARRELLLLHCETGVSTSLAVFAAYKLLKRQVRVADTIAQVGMQLTDGFPCITDKRRLCDVA